MEAQEVFSESVVNALSEVGADAKSEPAEHALMVLSLVWKKAAPHIRPDDEPGLFWPIVFLVNDKPEAKAGVLALKDRLIIMWTTGTFRSKDFQEVVPYASILSTTQTVRPPDSRISKELLRLRITAAQPHELLFLPETGGAVVAQRIEGMISGTFKPPADVD